jgi:hypothetical protein
MHRGGNEKSRGKKVENAGYVLLHLIPGVFILLFCIMRKAVKMKIRKKMTREHMYLLSLLESGPMDISTITNVSFSTRKRIRGLIEDLMTQNLIIRMWDNGGFLYGKV